MLKSNPTKDKLYKKSVVDIKRKVEDAPPERDKKLLECGLRLKYALSLENLSQKELAAKCNYSKGYINDFATGKRKMPKAAADNIGRAFPVPINPDYLLCLSDDIFQDTNRSITTQPLFDIVSALYHLDIECHLNPVSRVKGGQVDLQRIGSDKKATCRYTTLKKIEDIMETIIRSSLVGLLINDDDLYKLFYDDVKDTLSD